MRVFPSFFLFQIVFEATRGPSLRSDIAIDDIILEGGPCQGKQHLYRYLLDILWGGLNGPGQLPDSSLIPPLELEIKATAGTSNEIE